MKLLVCTNFAQPFHTGGAERVIQQITESMTEDHGWECVVFSQHGNSTVIHNKVKVVPVGNLSEEEFLQKLNSENADHIFVYSDWFFRWETILNHAENIKAKKSIALVGMNRMRSSVPKHKQVCDLFRRKHQHFKVLAHADKYIDAVTCRGWGIPVSIIHNAIDLKEFTGIEFDFKSFYNIKTSKMLLCVANFFPGKGQEYLLPIIKNLKNRQDVTLVFVYTHLAFEVGNRLQSIVQQNCERAMLPVKFLKNIPRKHVIQAYYASDIQVFPSCSECGPIVILESMAAKKPWVALNVGHIPELRGGRCIKAPAGRADSVAFDANVSKAFLASIDDYLNLPLLCKDRGEEGRKQVEQEYNWELVKKQYMEFFQYA